MSFLEEIGRLEATLSGPLPPYLKGLLREADRYRRRHLSGSSATDVLAEDYAGDAVAFARDVLFEFAPHPWQTGLLSSTAPRTLVLAARQSGKSSTVGALALHKAVTEPRSVVVIVAPTARQSELFVDRCKVMLTGTAILADCEILSKEIRFNNGSVIRSLPGNPSNIRGHSADLLVLDEAALMDDALFEACLPMVAATKGRIIQLSTPFGPRGFFWRLWETSDDWHKVAVPAADAPAIDREELERARRDLPPYRYAQEFEIQFNVSTYGVFRAESIAAMLQPDVPAQWDTELRSILVSGCPERVFPHDRLFAAKLGTESYLVTLDIGIEPDPSALLVARTWKDDTDGTPRLEVFHIERAWSVDYPEQEQRLAAFVRQLHAGTGRPVRLVIDATTGGSVVSSHLKRMGCRHEAVVIGHSSGKPRPDGKRTVAKSELVMALQTSLQLGHFKVSNVAPAAHDLLSELGAFSPKITDTGFTSFEGRQSHDDLVVACMLATWAVGIRTSGARVLRMSGF